MFSPWHMTILDEPARLVRPEYLAVAGGVLLLGLVLAWTSWRRLRSARDLIPGRLLDKVVPGFSPGRSMARLGLAVCGALLLSLALVQPECGMGRETISRTGIDLVVALDASRSMLAADIQPDRFERARMELAALLEEVRGDKIGLVAFAGTPIIQVPLTTDVRAAAMYLDAIHPDHMPHQGTNIGAALRTAHRMLKEGADGSSKVVLLISDGEDHQGDAREAARNLAADGIRLFTIGVGTSEGSLMVLSDDESGTTRIHRDQRGEPVLTRLDEDLMLDLAGMGGGSYVNTGGRGIGVLEVLDSIREMEQTEREVMEVVRYVDQGHWLLVPGFLMLLSGALLRPGRRRGGPALLLAAAAVCYAVPSEVEARRLLESEHPAVEEGNRAYAEGRHDAALEAYEAALEDDLKPEQRAAVHYNRGTAFAAKGDPEAARHAFEASKALADFRDRSRDYYNLGTSLLLTGDPKGAVEALTESLRREPGNRAAAHNLELALRALRERPPDSPEGMPDSGDEAATEDGDGEEDEAGPGDEDGTQPEQHQEDASSEEDPQLEEDGEPMPGEEDLDEDPAGRVPEDLLDPSREEEVDEDAGATDPSLDEEQAEGEADGAPGDERDKPDRAEAEGLDEQDLEAILDALEAGERPMQPYLFRPPVESETESTEGKDW